MISINLFILILMNTLVIEKDIDLNSLFSLNYNFDLLKTILAELLANNKMLNKHIDDLNKKIDSNEKKFNAEITNIHNKYDTVLVNINNKLDKHDEDIKDLYDKFNSLIYLKDKTKNIDEKLDVHNKKLDDHDDKINKSNFLFF